MHSKAEKLEAFSRLLDLMDTLRAECPWDRKQTKESIRVNTIEEVYELSEAILSNVPADIREELGDVLLHIVFYSKMAEEQKYYDIADVCNSLCDKMIARHPHIYGEAVAEDSEAVLKNWAALKMKEKEGTEQGVLSGVPNGLPSLIKAYRMQDKARGVGFDWEEPADAWGKFAEEQGEVREAIKGGKSEEVESEFGDLLFSLINVARLYKVNPDTALEKTNQKFLRRFNYVEQKARQHGQDLNEMSLEEMDKYWDEAKAKGL